MATACFRFLTFFPEPPDLRVPRLYSPITLATFALAFLRIWCKPCSWVCQLIYFARDLLTAA